MTDRIIDLLQKVGLYVSNSFNLQTALTADIPYDCPIHPRDCDCNMAVLLVYGTESQPATLLLRSHADRTWLTLVDNSEERPSNELNLRIKSALAVPLVKGEITFGN